MDTWLTATLAASERARPNVAISPRAPVAPQNAASVVERDVGPDARLLFHLGTDGRLVGVSGVGPAALARDVRLAQLMIERGVSPDPAALADPAVKLKGLLR